MPRKKINSVACVGCGLTINEPKTPHAIREKLRALGWRFIIFAEPEVVVGRCAKCLCDKNECSFYRPARFTGKLEDMVSPYLVQ
jgi:hypothetical protein